MPVQIIYPVADRINYGWTTQSSGSPLYAAVDEGTLSANDGDFIAVSGGFNILSSPPQLSVGFSGGSLTIYPKVAYLNARILRKDTAGLSAKFSDKTGTEFTAINGLTSGFYPTSGYFPLGSSVDTWGDYRIPLNITRISGSVDFSSSKIDLQVSGISLLNSSPATLSKISGVLFSALEIEVSGDYSNSFCTWPKGDGNFTTGPIDYMDYWDAYGVSGVPGAGFKYTYIDDNKHYPYQTFEDSADNDFSYIRPQTVIGGDGPYSAINSTAFDLGWSPVSPVEATLKIRYRKNCDDELGLGVFLHDFDGKRILQTNNTATNPWLFVSGGNGVWNTYYFRMTRDNVTYTGPYNIDNLVCRISVVSGVVSQVAPPPSFMDISSCLVCISGVEGGSDSGSTGNIPLYISGIVPTGVSGNIPLYISGGIAPGSGFLDLYTIGGNSSDLDLFIAGYTSTSSGIPLYTHGSFPSGCLNLFISAGDPHPISGNLPLYIRGNSVGTSGLDNFLPLFVKGISAASYMNLFLQGASTIQLSGSMNLYVGGTIFSANSGIPLYLYNSTTPINSSLPLHTRGKGYGVNEPVDASGGFFPIAASMNLFINRPNESRVIPLFLCNNVTTSSVPLYTMGAYAVNSSVALSMPYTKSSSSGNIPLYIHGF